MAFDIYISMHIILDNYFGSAAQKFNVYFQSNHATEFASELAPDGRPIHSM